MHTIAAPGTPQRAKLDVAMLAAPKTWPRWPNLPLKGHSGRLDASLPTLGVVTADFPTIVLREAPSMRGILIQLAIEVGLTMPGSDAPFPVTDAEREAYQAAIVKRYDDTWQLTSDWTID